MKRKIITSFVMLSILFMVAQSCQKNNEGTNNNENEKNNSANGSSKSHNTGQNCMNCHKSGGSGESIFNVAGSLYDSLKTNIYANATINLYSGPGGTGTIKNIIKVDALGNFYTTDNIIFGTGLYPSVKGNLTTNYMSTSITTGQCSSCHGVSTDKMWTK